MNQVETQYQEILHTLDRLLANLGLVLEDYDVEYLTQADLYIEIFKIMFPVLGPVLNADFGEDITDEELIQYLINVLAKDIINMDLGHIRGDLIAQGDAKNILNFLQLLYEISNMVADKGQGKKPKKGKKNEKLIKSSGNSVDQTSNHSQKSSLEWKQKYNSVQGINAEFSNSEVTESNPEAGQSERESYGDENGDAWQGEGNIAENLMHNKMIYEQQKQMKGIKTEPRYESQSVSRISEVSKSKESSEYDKGTKKLSRNFNDYNVGMPIAGAHAKKHKASKRSNSDLAAKHASHNSDDIRELRGEYGEEVEEEAPHEELEEEQERGESQYYEENEPGYTPESLNKYEEGEEQYEEEGEPGEGEEQEQEGEEMDEINEEEYYEMTGQKRKGEPVQYYENEALDYNKQVAKGHQPRRSHEEKEDPRTRQLAGNMYGQAHGQAHGQIHGQVHGQAHGQEEEEEEEYEEGQEEVEGQYGQYEQYEQEEQEEQEYEDEGQEGEEREEMDQIEEYGEEGQENYEEQGQIDPRHMDYVEEMEEVVEEEEQEEEGHEEEHRRSHGSKNSRKGMQPQDHVQEIMKAKKSKTKSKAAGKKKKSSAKAEEDYQKGKVQYRALKPATAGMKVHKQKKSSTTKTGKAPARKSKDSSSSHNKSRGMVHSKSERNLYNTEEEAEQPQAGTNTEEVEENMGQEGQEAHEEYSEDHGMGPKGYPVEENQGNYEEEGQEEGENIPEGNVFKILSDNVMRVKENLRDNRAIEDIPFDDERTVKMILAQKNQYKQYLKDFIKDHQLKEKKYEDMRELSQKNFHKKLKSEKIRDETVRKGFENQQKSLYFKMRDEKVNYLRKVHKTIFELEKKRIIDDKKEYMDFRKTRNNEAQHMIDSIKNEYKNKLSILRERNTNQQQERKLANDAQRSFLQNLEKELKQDQAREVERLKNKWRHEKEKFDMMIKDEGFLERRIMDLYKKGTF